MNDRVEPKGNITQAALVRSQGTLSVIPVRILILNQVIAAPQLAVSPESLTGNSTTGRVLDSLRQLCAQQRAQGPTGCTLSETFLC